jgi:hypothetical protein
LRFVGVAEYADQSARRRSCASFTVEEEEEGDEEEVLAILFTSLHSLSLT